MHEKNAYIGTSRTSLPTPCLVLDIDTFQKNLMVMREMASSAGKLLRPHAKTHKCSRVAALQIANGGCAGVCAAKLSEAAVLLASGIHHVLITSPVVTKPKIEHMTALAARHPGLICVIDAKANANEIDHAARRNGIRMDVLVDIDPEMGRTGIPFADAVSFASFVSSLRGLRLRGVQCYAGHLQHIRDSKERSAISLERMGKAAGIFREIKRSVPDIDIFTGTGTGTSEADLSIPELTDIQVGSYCVMDAEYLNLGGCSGGRFDTFTPAMTLLATVISTNRPDFVTVDAGLKQLYYTPSAPPEIIGRDGWRYEWFGDEHGKIYFAPDTVKPVIGDVIELMLPHCDPTINLHDALWVTQHGKVIDQWDIDMRGMGQ